MQPSYKPNTIPQNFPPVILAVFILLFFIGYFGFVKAKEYYKNTGKNIVNEILANPTPNLDYAYVPNATTSFIVTPTPVTTPTVKPTIITKMIVPTRTYIQQQTNCYIYKITIDKFQSAKCYTDADYSSLNELIGDYEMEKFKYDSAVQTQKFTCDGSEFFKKSCDEAKSNAKEAKNKMSDLESKIKNIIARGK